MDIERMYRMHKMILNEATGSPKEFAEKFKIRPRQLLNLLEEFKLCGASIKYSRKRVTYFEELVGVIDVILIILPLEGGLLLFVLNLWDI